MLLIKSFRPSLFLTGRWGFQGAVIWALMDLVHDEGAAPVVREESCSEEAVGMQEGVSQCPGGVIEIVAGQTLCRSTLGCGPIGAPMQVQN